MRAFGLPLLFFAALVLGAVAAPGVLAAGTVETAETVEGGGGTVVYDRRVAPGAVTGPRTAPKRRAVEPVSGLAVPAAAAPQGGRIPTMRVTPGDVDTAALDGAFPFPADVIDTNTAAYNVLLATALARETFLCNGVGHQVETPRIAGVHQYARGRTESHPEVTGISATIHYAAVAGPPLATDPGGLSCAGTPILGKVMVERLTDGTWYVPRWGKRMAKRK